MATSYRVGRRYEIVYDESEGDRQGSSYIIGEIERITGSKRRTFLLKNVTRNGAAVRTGAIVKEARIISGLPFFKLGDPLWEEEQ